MFTFQGKNPLALIDTLTDYSIDCGRDEYHATKEGSYASCFPFELLIRQCFTILSYETWNIFEFCISLGKKQTCAIVLVSFHATRCVKRMIEWRYWSEWEISVLVSIGNFPRAFAALFRPTMLNHGIVFESPELQSTEKSRLDAPTLSTTRW